MNPTQTAWTLAEVDVADVFQIALGMLAIIVLVIGGMYLARRVRSWSHAEQADEGFSLHGLREMRRTGQISEEEFAELRQRIIKTAVAVPAPADTAPPDDEEAEDDLAPPDAPERETNEDDDEDGDGRFPG